MGGHTITSIRPSVCFHSNFWAESPLTLTFCMCMHHDHSSPGIKGQGQPSNPNLCSQSHPQTQLLTLTWSVWPRSSIEEFSSYSICSGRDILGMWLRFFTNQMPFLSSNQQCQSTEENIKHREKRHDLWCQYLSFIITISDILFA